MDPVQAVDRQDQQAALSDEHRLALLRRLMCEPSTITRLGRYFDRHPAWIRYHIKRLEAVGLVESAGEVTTRNYTERFYRATATAYTVQMLVVPDTGSEAGVVALGSDDFALQLLADDFNGGDLPRRMVASSVGSLDGLIALRQGLADIAGCHLLDVATGDYNVPYLRHLFPDRAVNVVTLSHREQGLMHRPSPTPRIRGIEDLADPSVRFVNRNRGSGTRVWLDSRFRELGIEPDAVRGYDLELRTHSEVALAVASGQADAGVGVRAAAERHGLAFEPLFNERYDLVSYADRAEEEPLARLRDRLGSRRFRRQVGGLRGYDAEHTGDETRLAV